MVRWIQVCHDDLLLVRKQLSEGVSEHAPPVLFPDERVNRGIPRAGLQHKTCQVRTFSFAISSTNDGKKVAPIEGGNFNHLAEVQALRTKGVRDDS